VFWLDTGRGQLARIATSADEFKSAAQPTDPADEWFKPQLLGDLLTKGIRLGRGQCYSYKIPPTFGGRMEPSNFEPVDLPVHFGILGQIQRQVRNLPEGTRVRRVEIKA
jgi:Domain of unknown function (DUF1851)